MNKAKLLKNAEKYVLQGKFSAAISEYQKILEFDPNDLSILNTIGDLYVRSGDVDQGLKQFNRLATAFHDSGFKVKAIAIYKKITKLAPHSVEAHRHLAELYALQGLMSEAQVQYMQLADAYLAESKVDAASDALQKLHGGDPDNISILNRLVDVEVGRGNSQGAVDLLVGSAERLRKKEEHEKARELLARAEKIDAQAPAIRLQKAKIVFAEGRTDDAIRTLKEMDPTQASEEVQKILWELLYQGGRLSEAAEVAGRLFEMDPGQFTLLFSVSERFLSLADFDQAAKTLNPLVGAMAIESFGMQLSEMLQKILSEEPDHLPAIESAVAVNRRLGQSHLISLSLEHLASYQIKHGNFPAAMAAYQELLEIDPANSIVRQGMERLQGQTKGSAAGEGVPIMEPGGLGQPAGVEVISSHQPGSSPRAAIQDFSLQGVPGGGSTPSKPSRGAEDEEMRQITNSLFLEGEFLVAYGLLKRAAQTFEELALIAPGNVLALKRLVEIYTSLDQLGKAAMCCAKLSKVAFKDGQVEEARGWTQKATEYDVAVQAQRIETEPPPKPILVPPPVTPSETFLPLLKKEEFYDLSNELEQISEPRAAQAEPPRGAEEEPAVEEGPETAEDSDLKESLQEVDFYMEQRFWAEASSLLEKLLISHPQELLLQQRLEQCRGMAPPQAKRLEATAQEKLPPLETGVTKENAEKLQSATQGFGDILAEFNIVEGSMDAGSDFNTHYNLGIAFREMGLLEEAIAEVQKAISILNPETQKREYLSVCSLLGLCLKEEKNYPEAVECLERGVAAWVGDEKDEEYLSLQFDLAEAHQQTGNSERASEILQKIHQVNPGFRDVEKRLRALQKQ